MDEITYPFQNWRRFSWSTHTFEVLSWSTHTFEKQNWYALESSKLQVKAEFAETCPLVAWCPVILSVQSGIDVTLPDYMYLGVFGLL